MVQSRIFQAQRWLNIPARLLLTKNVGNVVGAESAGGMSLRKRSGNSIWAVFANESEQFTHLTRQGSIRGRQTAEIFFRCRSEQRHQAMLSRGAFGGSLQSKQLFLKALGAESLSAPPTARVSDDFVVLVIDGDRRGIGLHRELMAHVAWRHTVAVAIETQAEILVHERIDAIAIIQMDCGYELQTFWLKAFVGCLTGFTMTALIGHVLEPLMSLRVDVR